LFIDPALGGHVPRPSTGLSAERLRELARTGAETMLKQLRAEIIAIERTFPELTLTKRRRAVTRSLKAAEKRGREMSAAARKAISQRMKKYWAERKKAKAKIK
jgi:Holliday junction resolvasome RuvABC endonuclease subunit